MTGQIPDDVYEAAALALAVSHHSPSGSDSYEAADARIVVDAIWPLAYALGRASTRAEALKAAAQALLAEAEAYDEKWGSNSTMWDRGYVRGMKAAAHSVANSIDRPARIAEGNTDDA